MSLFVLASKDGWVQIMYTGLDAVGVDMQVWYLCHVDRQDAFELFLTNSWLSACFPLITNSFMFGVIYSLSFVVVFRFISIAK